MKKRELKALVHQQAQTIQRQQQKILEYQKENNDIRQVFESTKMFLDMEIDKLRKPNVDKKTTD